MLILQLGAQSFFIGNETSYDEAGGLKEVSHLKFAFGLYEIS